MEGKHGLPDTPAKPFSSQARRQPNQGPKPAGGSWLLHHHEGNGAGTHLTFQHALSWVMKGVLGPDSVATIADFRPDQRVDMKPPGGKDLRRESGDFFRVFGVCRGDGNLRIIREIVKPFQSWAVVKLDEPETLLFKKPAFNQP